MIATVYYKPSLHMQHCAHCRQYISKGTLTAKFVISCDKNFPIYAYFHAACAIEAITNLVEDAKGKLYSE